MARAPATGPAQKSRSPTMAATGSPVVGLADFLDLLELLRQKRMLPQFAEMASSAKLNIRASKKTAQKVRAFLRSHPDLKPQAAKPASARGRGLTTSAVRHGRDRFKCCWD